MTGKSLRGWRWVHTWSSLVCTLFMLLLCLTGLPLIFSHEIDHLSGAGPQLPALPAETPRAPLDEVAEAAMRAAPGLVPLYFFAEADEPDLWYVKLDRRVDTDETQAKLLALDARSAAVLDFSGAGQGFMIWMYRLHVDLFAGLPGKLFLGLMGLLLIVSLVSGTVLYAPFMRKLEFGEVRRERPARIRWLDLHNLLGIVTLAWLLVVGITGVVNTGAELILTAWKNEQASRIATDRTEMLLPPLAAIAAGSTPAQLAMERALLAFPDMQPAMLAYPGTLLATPRHFAVLLHGKTPLTTRLRETVLVDPDTGVVLRAGQRPWYVTAFQLSQPLHFGDYGGLPLKMIWAVFDLICIVVLASGLYLWMARVRAKPAAGSGATETST